VPIGRQSREATRFRTRSWRDQLAALDQGRRSPLWVIDGLAGQGRRPCLSAVLPIATIQGMSPNRREVPEGDVKQMAT
jgi:hypothetical protein